MRRLILIGATTAAALALGGTALAASSDSSSDPSSVPSQVVVSERATPEDNPSRGVDDNPSRSVDDDPTPHETTSAEVSASPSVSATVDDHGGLRTHEAGDDHVRGGHGRDDRGGDDHGGSGHRR
ncbi:hypothetical protein ACQP00_11320 [Dactylosporangium sp. CS-047395]|uniref:hypothetical protein n=1 Tax=Dactylosporangium sp. CS-047395 TaxID=3239936 RepID=UPI003D950030